MAASLRKLQALLEFTDADLNANRRGRLSKAQIEDLKATSNNELKAILVIPILIVFWMLMYVSLKVALPALIIIGLIIAGIISLHRDHLKTYRDRKVRKLTGQLSKNPDDSKFRLAQYIISIDNEQLPIDRHLFEVLPEGKFAVYLLEKEQQILCMEPLRSSSSKSSTSSRRKSTARSTSRKSTSAKSSTGKRRTTRSTKKSASTAKAKSRTTSKSTSKTTRAKKSSASTRKAKPTSKKTTTSSSRTPAQRTSSQRRPTTRPASTTRVVAKQAKPKGIARPMQWTRTRETSDRN